MTSTTATYGRELASLSPSHSQSPVTIVPESRLSTDPTGHVQKLWFSEQTTTTADMYNISTLTNNASFNDSGGFVNESVPYALNLPDGAKAGLILLYALTTLLSLSGNVLVVLVFVRGRRCRTDIRPYLINLAVADLVMAIFCMPFTFTLTMMKTWIFSEPMCPVVLFMQHLSVSASVFTNVAIGSDRFLVVMFPLKSRVTTARVKYVLGTIWSLAVALSSVQLFVGRAFVHDGVIKCDEVWNTPSSRRVFTMFVLFITYIIPLIILAVAYSIVGVLLWRRSTPGNADHSRDVHQLQAKRKVVKMLILVVAIFALCWLPLHTFFLVIDFNPEVLMHASERLMTGVYYTVHWLAMSNSFANPFIYSFTNDSFRADLAYIFYVVFPFCKCLKKMAYRKLSVMSVRQDNRLQSTVRPSPAHSPYRGAARSASEKHLTDRQQRHLRLYNGNRVYLTLGARPRQQSPDSPSPSTTGVEEQKSFLSSVQHSHSNNSSPVVSPTAAGRRSPPSSYGRTAVKTANSYV